MENTASKQSSLGQQATAEQCSTRSRKLKGRLPKLSRLEASRMLAEYRDPRVKLNELVKRYDITKQTIRKYVKQSGMNVRYKERGRHNPITTEESDRIMSLREMGLNQRQIALMVNRSQTGVSRVIKRRELELVNTPPSLWQRIKWLFK
jgi:predicted flavoprotein YhiN